MDICRAVKDKRLTRQHEDAAMNQVRLSVGAAILGLGLSMGAGAQAGCTNILTSEGSCMYFGLPDSAGAGDRETATRAAAAQVGGVVCRFGDGEGETLVAGHAGSCERAGGTLAPMTGAGGLQQRVPAASRDPGPVVGYMPVTQYVPVFAGPSRGSAKLGGETPPAVTCTVKAERLSAASVEDCARAGGTASTAK